MTIEEFQSLLDARGPDPAAWGAWRRLRARRLLRTSPEARRRHAEAVALSRALETLDRDARAPQALQARLQGIPAAHRRPPAPAAVVFARGWWTAGAAAGAACFLAGIALGALWLQQPPESEIDLATVVYAQVTTEEDWQ